eukprot:CAMPEP_0182421766 /NCGR_PEP_ID=MMETSP1167-20130531/7237_1 /TAXON_ID=2988 /ORGANISM="Mallomonas Sp, Strain CCMP3275" /LENGTH=247 /DNA_ID=CAMNT_0024599209 /DNA_START=560 /DNA_END=1303 /DNA_ORIENTATION=+
MTASWGWMLTIGNALMFPLVVRLNEMNERMMWARPPRDMTVSLTVLEEEEEEEEDGVMRSFLVTEREKKQYREKERKAEKVFDVKFSSLHYNGQGAVHGGAIACAAEHVARQYLSLSLSLSTEHLRASPTSGCVSSLSSSSGPELEPLTASLSIDDADTRNERSKHYSSERQRERERERASDWTAKRMVINYLAPVRESAEMIVWRESEEREKKEREREREREIEELYGEIHSSGRLSGTFRVTFFT